MRVISLVVCALFMFATASAQSLIGTFPAGGGAITITPEGGSLQAAGLDFISANNGLIPIPPGDLTAPATPFSFLLANGTDQVTYGNLGSTVDLSGPLTLSVGAVSGAEISASWGDGGVPAAFSVTELGDPTPQPNAHLEINLGGSYTASELTDGPFEVGSEFKLVVDLDRSLPDLVVDDATIGVFDDPIWQWHLLGPDDGPIVWLEGFRVAVLKDNDPLKPVLPDPFGGPDGVTDPFDYWPPNCPVCKASIVIEADVPADSIPGFDAPAGTIFRSVLGFEEGGLATDGLEEFNVSEQVSAAGNFDLLVPNADGQLESVLSGDINTYSASVVPEPSSFGMFSVGVGLICALRRRQR